MLKWGFLLSSNYVHCVLFNFEYRGDHKTLTFANSLNEHEIIMSIYNWKKMQVRFIIILHAQDIFLWAIWPCITMFGIQAYLNKTVLNWSTQSADSDIIIPFWIGQPNQLIQTKSFIPIFLVFIELALSTIYMIQFPQNIWLVFISPVD